MLRQFPKLILVLMCLSLHSQVVSTEVLDKIDKAGKKFTSQLVNGEIEFLKDQTPPPDTWTYSRLEEFKQAKGKKAIAIDRIILPSADPDSKDFTYNVYALDIEAKQYYFVAIVAYEVIDEDIEFQCSFIFTEPKSLRSWWEFMFSYYMAYDIEKFPEHYLFQVPPRPPPKI